MHLLLMTVALLAGAAELLDKAEYRAVTLEPKQRKSFHVPTLERVSVNQGTCVEEGLDGDEPQTFWLQGHCSGVRTVMVWRADGRRVHVMACAEDSSARSAPLVKLRQKIQAEIKSKQHTACVRNGHVEIWGWAESAEEKAKLDALETKYGIEHVRNFVEIIEADLQ